MSLRFIVVAILCLCIGGGAIWFFSHFERRTEKQWVGFQGKARHDPWLAAQRLVQRMGGDANEVRAIPELATLPRNARLLLPSGRLVIDEPARARLLAWVRGGGRLVIAAEPAYQPDPLLDALGVQRRVAKPAPLPKGEEENEKFGIRLPVKFALPADQPPVVVLLDSTLDLKAANATESFGHRGVTAALLLTYGEGRVLVLNDFSALSNYGIGEQDHAEFLWRVVRIDNGRPTAYFFYDPRKLSLLQWFRENAWAAAAGFALFLAAWLWRNAPRFGPVVPDPARVRRRLLDHLRASGRFLWLHGGGRMLAEAAREACMRRILRTYPELLGVSEAERPARVAELLGMDAAQARALFATEAPARAFDFIQTIQVYQAVHESLALARAGGRARIAPQDRETK